MNIIPAIIFNSSPFRRIGRLRDIIASPGRGIVSLRGNKLFNDYNKYASTRDELS